MSAKWPRKFKHRNKVLAKVYRPCAGRNSYRVVWEAAGKRQMKSFPNYSGPGGAKEYAEKIVPGLAKHSLAVLLTPGQAKDALAAIAHLNDLQLKTGRKVSLLTAVSKYCSFTKKLGDRDPEEVADGYLRNVASVNRRLLAEAVEEFILSEEPRTKAPSGQRAQIAEKYHYVRAHYLRRFAKSFQSYLVCDLAKANLDGFFSSELLRSMSPKSRNHHRTAIAQFLGWCVRKDYLAPNHRLLESDGMRREEPHAAEIQFYTAKEFADLLKHTDDTLRPIVAIAGLAGLRIQEILRLDWSDVWRINGYIEVTAGKSKTRQRRLVEIGKALKKWLAPYRQLKSGPLWTDTESVLQKSFADLADKAEVGRKRNGLRSAFCSCAYALHGEVWTAQQAGHTPAILHANYRGLATKKEAEAWFAVMPPKALSQILVLPQRLVAA